MTFVAQALSGTKQLLLEMVKVSTTQIPHLNPLEIVPDPFIRIELRSIAWQLFQVQPFGRSLRKEGFDFLAAMDWGAIPNQQDFASDLA